MEGAFAVKAPDDKTHKDRLTGNTLTGILVIV